MPTFIATIKLTDQGTAKARDTVKRSEEFKSSVKAMGVSVIECYWTLGAVDGFLLFEAPDEETATAAMLDLSSQGNVHTQTARAFRAEEMEAVLGKLA